MPDLTIEMMQQCRSLEERVTTVGGYVQTGMFSERAWPECTCPAYKFAKRTINFSGRMVAPACKHIKQGQKENCNWHQLVGDPPQTEKQKKNMECPKCKGETVWVRVGV